MQPNESTYYDVLKFTNGLLHVVLSLMDRHVFVGGLFEHFSFANTQVSSFVHVVAFKYEAHPTSLEQLPASYPHV